jgi:hypothetical protein
MPREVISIRNTKDESNAMVKENMKKRQTMIQETLHRKLNIEQNEHH